MIFVVDTMSGPYQHHINIFDHTGEIMTRVWSFDTDTLECRGKNPDDPVYVAAGFAFCFGSKDYYDSVMTTIPKELRPHVVPFPTKEGDLEDIEAYYRCWIKDYLVQSTTPP